MQSSSVQGSLKGTLRAPMVPQQAPATLWHSREIDSVFTRLACCMSAFSEDSLPEYSRSWAAAAAARLRLHAAKCLDANAWPPGPLYIWLDAPPSLSPWLCELARE